jgi:hypothetical protein
MAFAALAAASSRHALGGPLPAQNLTPPRAHPCHISTISFRLYPSQRPVSGFQLSGTPPEHPGKPRPGGNVTKEKGRWCVRLVRVGDRCAKSLYYPLAEPLVFDFL